MKKSAALTAAVLTGTVIAVGAGVPAQAAPKKTTTKSAWMTRKEFRQIKNGDSLATVRKIVGSNGKLDDSSTYTYGGYCDTWDASYSYCTAWLPETTDTRQTFRWKTSKHGTGYVYFMNGQVTDKTAWWIN